MLYKEKPYISKQERAILRTLKWDHAMDVAIEFKKLGFKVITFDKSTATPHMRIADHVDYWPATSRFYDYDLKAWGLGYDSLKAHLLKY